MSEESPSFVPANSSDAITNPSPLVTMQDVRMFMVDRTAKDNFLLDDLEFDDPQIISAMRLTVDKFNSTTPAIAFYTAETFPWRYELLLGTASILMRMAAVNMGRNRLDYSDASGTAVQDKNKSQEYMAMASAMAQEFETRSRSIKVSMNAESCYGSVSSGYSNIIRI